MEDNFWKKLLQPFLVLAPMYDVTDSAYRQIVVSCGKPDVMYTEFVSAEGLSHKISREKLITLHLKFEENERPIVAQLFTANLLAMREAARIVQELGFDGVDINMGCPDKKVVATGAGAALVKNPNLARSLIKAAKRGASDIPVSVKIRTGYENDATRSWVKELLKEGPAVITVHARTKKEMSKAPARWENVADAVEEARGNETLIVGNGDVVSREDAMEKANIFRAHGVMVGRGVLANPWFFGDALDIRMVSPQQRMRLALQHTLLFKKYYEGVKHFRTLFKHMGNYIQGFEGARQIRAELMSQKTFSEFEKVLVSLHRLFDGVTMQEGAKNGRGQ